MSFDQITIVVPGRAHGKVLKGNRWGMGQHLDTKSAAYMALVTSFAKQTMQGRPPIDEPIVVSMVEVREIPKSWSKRDRAAALRGEIWPTSKPDVKNIMAGVEDAMNHWVWRDDALIVMYAPLKKIYGEIPRLVVTVRSAEGYGRMVERDEDQRAPHPVREGRLL